jgi:aminoglycoside 6'-N-acetyltransferase I
MLQDSAIRRIVAADVDAVTAIYAEVLDPSYISFSEIGEGKTEGFSKLSPDAPAIFRKQLAALVDSPLHGFFIAEVGGEPAGFALASVHDTEGGFVECWLDDLGVGLSWRRRGVAKALVERVFAWGAEQNASYYLLESGVRNESAHHLFEQLGFRPLATVFWRGGQGDAQ